MSGKVARFGPRCGTANPGDAQRGAVHSKPWQNYLSRRRTTARMYSSARVSCRAASPLVLVDEHRRAVVRASRAKGRRSTDDGRGVRMTDTGQIPGEGLPENAGMVEQPGIPAPDAYTYLDPSEHAPEDEDLLLMPAPQGAWSDAPAAPAPAPSGLPEQCGRTAVRLPAAAVPRACSGTGPAPVRRRGADGRHRHARVRRP